MMRFKNRLLMACNAVVRRDLFSQPLLSRVLYGAQIAKQNDQSPLEWGTLLQRLLLPRYVGLNDRILDVGTGAYPVLPIFLKKRFPGACIVGSDILPDRIAHARHICATNGADVTFIVSDMFDRITGKFDLILFNPPAIPTDELEKLGVAVVHYPGIGARRSWSSDGGEDGLEVIRRFLDGAAHHLEGGGRIIMTVNPIHCHLETITGMCARRRLSVDTVHRLPGITNAYVIRSSPVEA